MDVLAGCHSAEGRSTARGCAAARVPDSSAYGTVASAAPIRSRRLVGTGAVLSLSMGVPFRRWALGPVCGGAQRCDVAEKGTLTNDDADL
ncbi:hypothetical protein GCM10023323_12410 [Streptomyces thinghirensis]|uniref:Uncharacterized protein n=1 Tax=Streptomyces thinghirensis TaxID=551547 RepID=A0ABP9SZN1_9ACTN